MSVTCPLLDPFSNLHVSKVSLICILHCCSSKVPYIYPTYRYHVPNISLISSLNVPNMSLNFPSTCLIIYIINVFNIWLDHLSNFGQRVSLQLRSRYCEWLFGFSSRWDESRELSSKNAKGDPHLWFKNVVVLKLKFN